MSRSLKNFFAASFIAVGVTFAPTICDFDGWLISSVAHAEINEYVGVGESIMSDRDTGEIAKQSAKLQAIRNAQEIRRRSGGLHRSH